MWQGPVYRQAGGPLKLSGGAGGHLGGREWGVSGGRGLENGSCPSPKAPPWLGGCGHRPPPSPGSKEASEQLDTLDGGLGGDGGGQDGRKSWRKRKRSRQQGVFMRTGRKGPRLSTPALWPLPVDFNSGSSKEG